MKELSSFWIVISQDLIHRPTTRSCRVTAYSKKLLTVSRRSYFLHWADKFYVFFIFAAKWSGFCIRPLFCFNSLCSSCARGTCDSHVHSMGDEWGEKKLTLFPIVAPRALIIWPKWSKTWERECLFPFIFLPWSPLLRTLYTSYTFYASRTKTSLSESFYSRDLLHIGDTEGQQVASLLLNKGNNFLSYSNNC